MDITATPLASQEQVCRTCVHGNDRLWNRSLAEVVELGKDRKALAELRCNPQDAEVTFKIRRDGVLVDLRNASRPVVASDLDPSAERNEPVFVDSCGFRLAPKCRNCARLRVRSVRIPHNEYPGSLRDVVIMASCSIPAEGIEIDGKTVTCAPRPVNRLTKISPSCENCKFRMTTDESWQWEDFSVNAMDLTPFEMEQVRRQAGGNGPWVGRAINQARMAKYQSLTGRVRWYGVEILAEIPGLVRCRLSTTQEITLHLDGGDIVGYTVHRFDGDRFEKMEPEQMILTRLKGQISSLQIHLPKQAPLGLVDAAGGNDGTKKRVRVFPPLPDRVGARYWIDPNTRERRRQWDRTPDYFESRKPYYSSQTDTVQFRNPPVHLSAESEEDWQYRLQIVAHEGSWRVVDDRFYFHELLALITGQRLAKPMLDPHPTVFKIRLRSLLDIAKRKGGTKAVLAIRRQFREIEGRLPLSRTIDATPNFFRFLSLEPFKEYCSLNLADPSQGVDFRDLFGDTFGMDRTQYSRTWSYQMERDEWYRATHAGNEINGEIMQTEMLDPAWPDCTPDNPDVWEKLRASAKVISLDVFGNDIEEPESMTTADRIADVQAYLAYLDEPVVRENEDGHPIWEDRRMQLHGYTMYQGSRLESSPNFFMSAEGEDITGELYCAVCEKAHPLTDGSESGNYFPNLICPDCGTEMHIGRRTEPSTWVRMGKRVGIGTAVAADSEAYQNRQRLRGTVCPSWQFRSNPSITFHDIYPQKTATPVFRPDLDKKMEEQLYAEYIGIDTSFISGSTTGGWYEKK